MQCRLSAGKEMRGVRSTSPPYDPGYSFSTFGCFWAAAATLLSLAIAPLLPANRARQATTQEHPRC